MKFAYTYRTSDGQRHSAEIEAESRDAAFARLRNELGIRAIRVTAIGEEDPNGLKGSNGVKGLNGLKGPIGLIGLALAIIVGLWWWLAGERDARPYQVMTPQGPVTYTVAEPLPRQRIPGDRRRIEEAIEPRNGSPEADGASVPGAQVGRDGVFRFPAEAYLARYAEPGRPIKAKGEGRKAKDVLPSPPSTHSFKTCLAEPIRIASTDFTEVVDLKRIVTGMKLEMRAYLAGGGTVEQYLAELEKRQRLEISYRENAERRLNEMLAEAGRAAARQEADLYRAAYSYWLKANAQLQAMGIYPLALPDTLRTYQMGLGLED